MLDSKKKKPEFDPIVQEHPWEEKSFIIGPGPNGDYNTEGLLPDENEVYGPTPEAEDEAEGLEKELTFRESVLNEFEKRRKENPKLPKETRVFTGVKTPQLIRTIGPGSDTSTRVIGPGQTGWHNWWRRRNKNLGK